MESLRFGDSDVPKNRGILIEVHLADLHFGAFEPKKQYDILMDQVYTKIEMLPKVDIISIDGDIFDHKVMSNSDAALYATKFIDHLAYLSKIKNATLVLLAGTYSHDFDQLKLFYHYMDKDPKEGYDIRVITNIQFEYIKGAKILMIPELNGLDESIYQKYFFYSGWYDEAFVHGTFEGSVYGNLTSGSSRLLTGKDFIYCKGVAISGHVHTPGCFQGFYYYCGCPYRWKFGEEESKGFIILAHDLDTQIHYVSFQEVTSFRYDTIFVDELLSEDPKVICDWINKRRVDDGIDYIKVRFRADIPGYNKTVINNYYRNNPNVTVEFLNKDEISESKETKDSFDNSEYSYLIDNSISDLERFVRYVNDKEGDQFISVEQLSKLLAEII
jgi:DNA repair exonuclease SbcCD nuclease subunit